MNAPDVSIVIVGHSVRDELERCLASISTFAGVSAEVIVVDNASTDDTRAWLAAEQPGVTVVALEENRGVAAREEGLRLARGRYTMFLDSDAALTEHALPRLVGALDAQPEWGLLGPKLVHDDGTLQLSCRRFPPLLLPLLRRPPLERFARSSGVVTRHLMTDVDHDRARAVPYVLGACQIFRTSLARVAGPFDTNIFYGPDDVDWCIRIRDAGGDVVYYPDATVVHSYRRITAAEPVSRMSLRHLQAFAYLHWKYRRRWRALRRLERELDARAALATLHRLGCSCQDVQAWPARPSEMNGRHAGTDHSNVSARVAVLVPCHDDGRLVAAAVHSVAEEEPVEVVVVDDASSDPETLTTLDELDAEGMRIIRLPENVGVPQARTTALRATGAPYVFPLDADDVLVPGALAAMADRLDADPAAAVCFGEYEEFGAQSGIRSVPAAIDPFRVALANEWGAPLLRRTVLEDVGGWLPEGEDSRAFPYEDWHVWMSLAERGARGIHMGPGFVTYRRRIQSQRRLSSDRRRHRDAVATLRRLHPRLFDSLREHERASQLGRAQKLLLRATYGARPRLPFERRLRHVLDRMGIGPDALLARRSATRD
jgi:GT2 family glycosyltransferase